MHANDQAQTQDERKPARTAVTTSGPGGGLPAGLLALQSSAGNAAVVQMLRQADHAWAQPEQHQHGAGCGHRQTDQAAQPAVQRSAVHDVLHAPGRPMDDATRTDMETRLGADFSDVRIHNDSAAKASAAEVGARAYTSGSHVVIGDGGADKHTLAHELTHVIQQRQGPVAGTDNGNGLKVSNPTDHFEREAEANARRALSGQAPAQHDHGPTGDTDNAGHSDAPVQRASAPVQRTDTDTEMASQSSDMDVDQPAQVDHGHKANVATALNNLRRDQKWSEVSILKGQVVTTGVRASRAKPLRQIGEDNVRKMYRSLQDSSVDSGHTPAGPKEAAIVWAEVEAIGEYLVLIAEARAAAAGGALYQTGKVDGKPKKQAALHTSTIAGQRGVELPSLTLPGKDHIRPVAPTGPTTPDQVSTPGGSVLDRVGVYTLNNDDGSQSRMNFYSAAAEAREAELAEIDQSTLPQTVAQLGSGLERFPGTSKVAGPISLNKALLAQWSGTRQGWSPDQNSAMRNVSAGQAAAASGYTGDNSWQWLHLIAFTMGGRDGAQPNEAGNLAAGLDAANGFHLVLESLVKKMVYDDSISDVTVTATANMIPNSFHVCKSIDYRLSWKKDGKDLAGTFAINALNPNRVMGSHIEMLCKQYGIKY
ncbi:DUF4157 domain-containing protein [Streptomyces sp. NPDC050516]|uniref:DUF4157 domain-containing protein n=1 Tax=Streptomyces sp. NPDC050516 TaxID=3365621 RepID=UPI0037AFAC0B